MNSPAITPATLQRVYEPMMLLSGAPKMTEELWAALYGLFMRAKMTDLELGQAVVDVLSREKFWPAPAVILERLAANRKTATLARREQERKDQMSLIRSGVRSEAEIVAARHRQRPKDLRRYGPEILGDSARVTPGPITNGDGEVDPSWPEIEGRMPAWKRKALFDAGLWSCQQAQAPTRAKAKAAKSAYESKKRRGPRHISTP